jgi:hypothetical protein
MTVVVLVVVIWLVVSIVVGVALARVFGGISPGPDPRAAGPEREPDERVARSA